MTMKYKKSSSAYDIDPEQFLNPNTPEVAYILGLLWADGSLTKTGRICVELKKEDADKIIPIFKKTGDWNIYERQRHEKDCNRKIQTSIHKNHILIYKFLVDNNYLEKSNCSPCKIVSKIPEHLKFYWFRGYFDGDGCLYRQNKSGYRIVFQISGSYEQDWKYFSNLFSSVGIETKIERKIFNAVKNHRGSQIRISNIGDALKICKYIYDGFENDKIGLERKYNIYKESKEIYENYKKSMEIEIIHLKSKKIIHGGTAAIKEQSGLSESYICSLRNGKVKTAKHWMLTATYENEIHYRP